MIAAANEAMLGQLEGRAGNPGRFSTGNPVTVPAHGHLRQITPPPGWKRDLWSRTAELRPAVRPGLIIRRCRGRLLVQDLRTAKEFLLGDIDSRVFLLANGLRSADKITCELTPEVSLGPSLAKSQVNQTLVQFIELGLLVLCREGRPSAA